MSYVLMYFHLLDFILCIQQYKMINVFVGSVDKNNTAIGIHNSLFVYYGNNDHANLSEFLKLQLVYIVGVDIVGPSFFLSSDSEMNISGVFFNFSFNWCLTQKLDQFNITSTQTYINNGYIN